MFPSTPRFALVLLLASLSSTIFSAESPWPAGDWRGVLDLGERQLEIIYHLEAEGSALGGSMDVPAQGAMGLPLRAVSVDGQRLIIEMPMGGDARFEGSHSGDTVKGTFAQAGQSFPMTLARADEIQPPARPQEPVGTLPYQVEEVLFENVDGIQLAGTLTRPDSAGRFPGVVLVAGAGPHDRDGTFMNHRPLLVLADHLTRAGFAVLRFDERGVGQSEGEFAPATAKQLAGDISSAVQTLREHEPVDGGQVGMIAHSEGGRIGALALDAPGAGDFIVLLGAPARPGIEALRAQAKQSPNPIVELQAAMAEAVLELDADTDAEPALRRAAQEMLAGLETKQRAAFGGREDAVVDQLVEALGQPQARFSLAFDPRPALRQADVPVLALYGGKDRQIDAAGAARALHEALGERAEVQSLGGLNHFFQIAETGAPSEYAIIEQTMSPEAMGAIVNWLHSITQEEH
ncbi:MAG: alpha/beta fold hydrolase [Wenzhouxiangellaceae bacterium]